MAPDGTTHNDRAHVHGRLPASRGRSETLTGGIVALVYALFAVPAISLAAAILLPNIDDYRSHGAKR